MSDASENAPTTVEKLGQQSSPHVEIPTIKRKAPKPLPPLDRLPYNSIEHIWLCDVAEHTANNPDLITRKTSSFRVWNYMLEFPMYIEPDAAAGRSKVFMRRCDVASLLAYSQTCRYVSKDADESKIPTPRPAPKPAPKAPERSSMLVTNDVNISTNPQAVTVRLSPKHQRFLQLLGADPQVFIEQAVTRHIDAAIAEFNSN